MRKKYKNPPINELVMGVYFREPIVPLRAEHIGLFWNRIRSEFPNCSQQLMIGGIEIQVPEEIFPLPRFWFVSSDESVLIQVQRNTFLFNWRKRDGEYPHYEQLKKSFDKYYYEFIKFIGDEFSISEPAIAKSELTYINMIEDQPYFQKFSDIGSVLPSFVVPPIPAGDQAGADFNVSYVYVIDAQLSLAVTAQSRRNRNSGKDVLYLELRSTGAPIGGSKVEADTLLDRAHDVIGETFNSLTSAKVQSEFWQPKES